MNSVGHDSLKTRRTLEANGQEYDYFSIKAAEENGLGDVSRLPFSLKVLLENLLRFEDNHTVNVEDIKALKVWLDDPKSKKEIAYRPARVLMQDFTGVPAVVDLAVGAAIIGHAVVIVALFTRRTHSVTADLLNAGAARHWAIVARFNLAQARAAIT